MKKEHQKRLTTHRRLLVNHLVDLEGILDHLISRQVITPALRERIIFNNPVPSDQIRRLLDTLIRLKITNAFDGFIEALVLSGNEALAKTLDKDYADSEKCRQLIEHEVRFKNEILTTTSVISSSRCSSGCRNGVSTTTGNYMNYQQRKRFTSPSPLSTNRLHFQHQTHIRRTHSPIYISPTTSVKTQFGQEESHEDQLLVSTISPCQIKTNGSGGSSCVTPNQINSPKLNGNTHHTLQTPLSAPSSCSSFPIKVAYCQLNSNQHNYNSYSSQKFNNNNSEDVIDDTFNLINRGALINDEIDWDDINNLSLDFEVYTNDEFTEDQLNLSKCYKMDSEPRGICLLINNEHFYDNENKELIEMRRYGTDLDAARLKNLFEKFHFQIQFETDLSEMKLKYTIRQFVNECERNGEMYDCICVIILSHGTDGYIYCSDFENKLNMDKDILSEFDNVMIGKPKLFIFQACRGENFNQKKMEETSYCLEESISNKLSEMKVSSKSTSTHSPSTSAHASSSLFVNTNLKYPAKKSLNDYCDGRPIKTCLPARSDFFIWYSSVRGFVSHRDTDGSPFIKCLVGVFSRYAKDLELVDMVRTVNSLMQDYTTNHFNEPNAVSTYFMNPVSEFHLIKKIYFNP